MIKWTKYGKRVDAEGTTIFYKGNGTNLTIESRKRHIPHANGIGTWDHTSYWVLRDGAEIAEKQSLGDAKQYAEDLCENVATVKIPVDRLPEALEPTLPHHTDERPAGMTFALSWAKEQYRRRADRAEMQKKRRAEGKS